LRTLADNSLSFLKVWVEVAYKLGRLRALYFLMVSIKYVLNILLGSGIMFSFN
jgi:hypothetical protein